MNLIKEISPRMIKDGGGHIATIASVASISFLNGAAEYCASKAAIYSFLNCFRLGKSSKKAIYLLKKWQLNLLIRNETSKEQYR